jgi:hypothetical protein
LSIIAALLYFVLPVALAIGLLFLIFRLLFKGIHHREQREAEDAELREKLKAAFPDTQSIGDVMETKPTDDEIDQSIQELKQDNN